MKKVLLAMTGWCDSGLSEGAELVIGMATAGILALIGLNILHSLAGWI